MIDLNALCKITHENATKRMNNGGHINTNTRSMLKHCATEVVEAVEEYTNIAHFDKATFNKIKEHFASELADIICCVLIIAAHEGIDIEQAIKDCIQKNRKRAEGTGINYDKRTREESERIH